MFEKLYWNYNRILLGIQRKFRILKKKEKEKYISFVNFKQDGHIRMKEVHIRWCGGML